MHNKQKAITESLILFMQSTATIVFSPLFTVQKLQHMMEDFLFYAAPEGLGRKNFRISTQ